MNIIKFLNEIKEPKVSELGGKGYSLAVLMNNRFNVPKGFVITSEAFFKFLEFNNLIEIVEKLASEINKNNFQEKSKEIGELILKGKIPEEITREIEEGLKRLDAKFVSIRSSAMSEDSLKDSFAGLHDTFLNVRAKLGQILENVKRCWASLFNNRAWIYRIKKRIPHFEGMAVIVQEMIQAEISGITFTKHPIDKKCLLVEASYGIGDMIVSGKVEPDDYTIDRKTLEIVEKKIGKKNKMSVAESENVKLVNVQEELTGKQVLSDDRIKEIAKTCLKVEIIFNYPQDIEWCISDYKIWLLQSRAITGVNKMNESNTKNVILRGTPACSGFVQGKVVVIEDPGTRVVTFLDNHIMVTKYTTPLLALAILECKGIVTEQGGITSHAATIARELGIPCIVGCEDATKKLSNGMEVILDGKNGCVYG